MTRRDSIRFAVLALFAGKLPAKLDAAGQLTVDLGQWGTIIFKHGAETVTITGRDIFDAIKKGGQS
jgi:hypothetical protein